MVLESVLVVAVPMTTVGDRSWLTGGQEEGSVLDDDWLRLTGYPHIVLDDDRSRLTGRQEEGSV
jgi:hypothetical protein